MEGGDEDSASNTERPGTVEDLESAVAVLGHHMRSRNRELVVLSGVAVRSKSVSFEVMWGRG